MATPATIITPENFDATGYFSSSEKRNPTNATAMPITPQMIALCDNIGFDFYWLLIMIKKNYITCIVPEFNENQPSLVLYIVVVSGSIQFE